MYSNIFDTHSHYDDDKFDKDRFSLLSGLKEKGVCAVVSCGCDIQSSKFNKLLSEKLMTFILPQAFIPKT